jgi:hypothetical protein
MTNLKRPFSGQMSYNPENPYVLNANYFENITILAYEDTASYIIFRSSHIISTTLSLFAIGFLIYLIVCKTHNSLKPYSRMLLICSITDLYYVLTHFLCQIVSRFLHTIDISSFLES